MQKRKRRSPSGKKEGGDRRLPRKKSPDHVLGMWIYLSLKIYVVKSYRISAPDDIGKGHEQMI